MEQTQQFVIVLGADAAGGEGLARVALAKIGTWFKGKQKIRITAEMLRQVVANFRKEGTGEVPIDYDHAIEYAAGEGQPVPAAGWIQGIEDAPDERGILWGSVKWTPRAGEMIRAQEYKYFSPVMNPAVRDNKTGEQQGWTLTSAALTNIPVLQELPAIALSKAGWAEEIERGDAGDEEAKRVVKLILADRVARTVRVVAEDGAESTLPVEGLEAPPEVLRLSEVKRAADGRFDFASVGQGEKLIAGEVVRAMEAQRELDGAVKAGKILPAQRGQFEKIALADLDGFRTLVASMKPQVDMGERGTGADGSGQSTERAVDAEITAKIEAKIVASQGKLGWNEAWKLVLGENPDLARRRKEAM